MVCKYLYKTLETLLACKAALLFFNLDNVSTLARFAQECIMILWQQHLVGTTAQICYPLLPSVTCVRYVLPVCVLPVCFEVVL